MTQVTNLIAESPSSGWRGWRLTQARRANSIHRLGGISVLNLDEISVRFAHSFRGSPSRG